MPPKIVLLHDARGRGGAPRLERYAARGAGDRGGARRARLRDGDAARRARPRRARARAARARAARRLQSRRVARGPRPAACTSSRRCSSRSACRSRAARRTPSATTSHKLAAKTLLRQADIATPAVLGAPAADDGPWIVKSVFEHASLGIDDSSVVRGAAAAARVLEARRAEFGGDWFAERFVAGARAQRRASSPRRRGRACCPSPSSASRASRQPSPRSSATRRSGTPTASSTATRSARSTSSPSSRRAPSGSRSPAGSCSRSTATRASTFASTPQGMLVRARDQRQSLLVAGCRVSRRRSQQAGIGYGDAIGWLIADARAARAYGATSQHDAGRPRSLPHAGRRPADVPALRRLVAATRRVLPPGAGGRARAARGAPRREGRRAATRSSSRSAAASSLGYARVGPVPLTRAHVRSVLDRRGARGAGAGLGPGAAASSSSEPWPLAAAATCTSKRRRGRCYARTRRFYRDAGYRHVARAARLLRAGRS